MRSILGRGLGKVEDLDRVTETLTNQVADGTPIEAIHPELAAFLRGDCRAADVDWSVIHCGPHSD